MAVTSVRELFRGRGGKADMFGHGDSTRVWRVVTDDPYDDESVVCSATGIPLPFESHPTRLNLWAKEAEGRNEDSSAYLWIVTVQYTSELPDQETAKVDPLERAWKDNFKPTRYQAPAIKGYFIDSTGAEVASEQATQNSAGDSFDPPPEKDASRLVISLWKNLPSVPLWVLDFQDAINEGQVLIRGLQFPACTLKANVEIGELTVDNGVLFRKVSLDIEYKKETWNPNYLDRGYNWRDAQGKLRKITLNGTECSQPMLLNGNGKPLGIVYDGQGLAALTSLTSVTGGFNTCTVGGKITVQGAGTAGADLNTTVASIIDDNAITLADALAIDLTSANPAQVTWTPNTVFYRQYRHYDKANFAQLNLPP